MKLLLVTMCKFYSGFGGFQTADSRIIFRSCRTENHSENPQQNLHEPLTPIVKK